ncbi:MAG: hypothetical protein ACXVCX_05645 [Ktedonobacterales bacterium]
MTLPILNFLFALLGIVFALGCALTALASLIYARSDHGFQRRLDIAFVLFAGFLAWGALSGSQQSFDRVSDPRLQSIPVDGLAYIGVTLSALLPCALLYVSLRRFGAAVRQLR